jgi:excisionase family DNA binding protein
MPEPTNEPAERIPGMDILTLSEAASLLRVEESTLAEVAARGGLPAQQIGAEWRFLKGALMQWLQFGPHFPELSRGQWPFWPLEPFVAEKLVLLLEQILGRLKAAEQPPPRPGSKQAVRRHVGVFKGDTDMGATLARLSALREAEPDEGGE